ncbi:serine hydrolase domain-containing protein [Actinokineospora iranica]|uniref:D-alanyl-D-alanine carboxypeptidase n=1 Tax=Actinokineospora iranica TaxID=1271860 RepID=A0A1G6X4H3_9PSEU|nr:serine hydrolase domain-containing protein [Actinokineospora iranica]SDD72991.1 D-alanyl-D-alanine carboxypeptidase [Actinokineospora iranica]
MGKGSRLGVVGVVATLALAGAGTASAGASPVVDQPGLGHRIDRQVVQAGLDALARTGAAGVQARVVHGWDRFTARAGVAEWGGQKPVSTRGRFRIGSVTKVFVSTVVLRLVGEGRVGLDAPVADYLPGLLPDGERITVRMLLQHTSGLYSYDRALPQDPAGFESVRQRHFEPEELVAMSVREPLDFAPGTAWGYSNTNYVVAGMLIEKVTGQSYEQAVEDRILRPLRLRDTSVPDRDRDLTLPKPHAHGYALINGQPVDISESSPSLFGAAGGMVSTTDDLDTFLDALLDGELLAPAQLAEMTKPLPFTGGYGLGLGETSLSCGKTVWGHLGGVPGYLTVAVSTRDTKTRLELSATIAPVAGGTFDGMNEVIDEVFCG